MHRSIGACSALQFPLSCTHFVSEKQENQYDGKCGIRALKVSPDGRHLASGDRSGNLRIYAVADFSLLYQLSAHDGEVLCLEYSAFRVGKILFFYFFFLIVRRKM